MACGALGICLCAPEDGGLAVVCPTQTLLNTYPQLPNETIRFVVEYNNVTTHVVPNGTYAGLEITENLLTQIPATENRAPLLNLTVLLLVVGLFGLFVWFIILFGSLLICLILNIFLKDNKITSLPINALFVLGPNLQNIDLSLNSITAVSDGALNNLSKLNGTYFFIAQLILAHLF